MPRPVLRDSQASFAGGINTVSDDLALQPDQIRLAENARLNEYGAIAKRNGSVKVATTALSNAPQNGFSWVRDSGAVQGLVVANGTLYTADMLSLPVASWTSQTGTLSTTVVPSFVTFINAGGSDCVFIADGGKLVAWDGTTLTRETSGSAASSSYIKVHNQRIWGCGDPSYPDSIFYSPLNNGSSFGHAGGGQIVVRTFSDEKVVALASVNSSLLIFHRRGISRLTGFGQDDISVAPQGVSSQTGTIAPYSVVEADGVAYFLSDRGAFAATEGAVATLGTPTSPDPLLPLLQGMTEANLAKVRGVLSRRTQEIWWFLPGYGVYVYHLTLRAWAGPWTGEYLNTACFWTSPVNGSAERFVIRGNSASAYDVTVSDYDSVTSDIATFADGEAGSTINMIVQLRRQYYGDDTLAKSFKWGYINAILGSSASVVVEWTSDLGAGVATVTGAAGGTWDPTATWTTASVWGPLGTKSYRLDLSSTGYYLDVKISNSQKKPITISRWNTEAFALGRR